MTPCPPLSDIEWPDSLADLKSSFATSLNVYRTMAHHPALLRAWAPLRQHIVLDSALGAELSEVVILRTAFRLQSDYEWSHHVHRATQLGFSRQRIAAIAAKPDGDDGLIVRAVDTVIDQHRLPTALETELAQAVGRKGVIDLIATVHFYATLGTLLLTYGTQIDDGIDIVPVPPMVGGAK